MEEGAAKRLEELFASTGIPREKTPDSYKFAEEHFKRTYGGPWNFNQIVGWIRLYIEGSHVGGHLWWVDAKRLRRNMSNRTFYLTTPSNILATHFRAGDDSDKIYRETLADIQRLSKETPLNGHYVDIETFRNIGPFINWRELLKTACKQSAKLVRQESSLDK